MASHVPLVVSLGSFLDTVCVRSDWLGHGGFGHIEQGQGQLGKDLLGFLWNQVGNGTVQLSVAQHGLEWSSLVLSGGWKASLVAAVGKD